MVRNYKIGILAFSLSLTGCVPHVYKYFQLDYKAARQTRECIEGKLASPGLTFIRFHEIRIIAMLKPDYLEIGFQVPAGQSIQLKDHVVVLNSGDEDSGAVESPSLIPVSKDYLRNLDALAWNKDLDPFGREDYFGPLEGASSVKRGPFRTTQVDKTYLFVARFHNDLPNKGVIKLPDMLINGHETGGAAIPFKRTSLLQGDSCF